MKSALCLLSLLLLASCKGDEKVELSLRSDQRDTVNERVVATLDSLRPILDSICTTTFDARVDRAVDSIVQRRLEEETRLRNRVRQ